MAKPLAIKPVPFKEAIEAAIRRKVTLPETYYGKMQGIERAEAFSVAGIAQLDQLQQVLDSLAKVLDSGATFDQWRDEILKSEAALALPLHRLDNIFRTNIQGAYARGKCVHIDRHKTTRPWIMYSAINDSRVRPAHLAMNGHVAKVGDPVWNTWMPPCGYRCRCTVISMTDAQAQKRAEQDKARLDHDPDAAVARATAIAKGPDTGWDYSPCERAGTEAVKAAKRRPKKLDKRLESKIEAIEKEATKRLRTWQDDFDSKTDDGKWALASLGNCPDDLRRVIARNPLKDVVYQEDLAHYKPGMGVIDMDGRRDRDSLRARSTWAHERGHHLDEATRNGFLFRSQSPDFKKAMESDAKTIKEGSGYGRTSKAATQRQATREAAYRAASRAVAAVKSKADRDALLNGMLAPVSLEVESVRRTVLAHSAKFDVVGATATADALDLRVARLATALKLGDAEGFAAALVGNKASPGSRLFVDHNGWSNGSAGHLSDMIGAITNNVVCSLKRGYAGHSETYYAKTHYQPLEVFANMTALYSSGEPLFEAVMRIFTPKTFAVWKGIIADAAK